MLEKLTESKAGKVGVSCVAVVAVGAAIFVGLRSMTGDGSKVADEKEVQAAAKKQIETVQSQNLPPALKAQIIAHEKGLLQPMNGAPQGPPPGK